MADNKKTPHSGPSIDEILAEAQTLNKKEKKEIPEEPVKSVTGRVFAAPDEIANQAKRALDAQSYTAPVLTSAPEKKKSRRFPSLFNRRKRKFAEFEEEEDIYYGLQLKTLEDYRDDYEKTIQVNPGKAKKPENDSIFSYLFQEEDGDSVDAEIAERFERMHSERRDRVAKVLEHAGLEHDDIFSLYDTVPFKKLEEQQLSSALPLQPQEEPVTEPEQPQVIPEPKHSPAPAEPAPKPEILPGPSREPDIREPIVEPAREPAPSSPVIPVPTQPGAMPQIRCRESEEPVKEPISAPVMKEEMPRTPPVKEPPAKPVPRMSTVLGYRSASTAPMHMVEVSDLTSVLQVEASSYPMPETQPPPEPIPLPVSVQDTEDIDIGEFKPPIILEQTAGFTPVRPLPDEDGDADNDENKADGEQIPLEPIQFPEPLVNEDEQEQEEEEVPKRKGFHIFGNEEEDNDSTDNLPGEQDELDDYSIPSDAPSISHDLGLSLGKMYLRLAVTGITCALLFLAGFAGEMSSILPEEVQLIFGVQPYLIVNLIFLLIAAGFCITAIFNGIKSLFALQANSDSAIAVATVAAVIQNVALMFAQGRVKSGSLHLYTALVVLAFFLNTAGKVSMLKRINKNFRFVAAPDQKQAVQIFDDHNTALQMAKGCVMDAPVIAYQTKTNFLKHFLRLSYEPDPSEQSSQTLAPILFVSSLILCIATLAISKNMYNAINAFAAAACVSVPFVNMLSINLPLNRLSKIASRCGAMIVGYPAVEQFSSTNAVMVDAKDLFPKGTVILNGIKTFAGQRIDDAIVDATALMCAVGGPLSDLFDQIIKSRRDMLPKIDNTVYEDNKGVTGWVSGRRILVGNRALMESHNIDPPSRDYEEKYISGGKKIIYLASGGDLVAMFVVSYSSDRRRALELRRMEDNGISLIVRTCDPNITPLLLAECFGLDERCISVMPQRLGAVYTEITAEPQGRSPALMATKGRPTAMMRMLTACVRQRGNISIAVALQNVSVILGFTLVAFMTFYSGLQHLSTFALTVYELFWIFAILFVPRLRKP